MVSVGRVIECGSWPCMSAIHSPAVDAAIRLRRQGIGDLVDFMTGSAYPLLKKWYFWATHSRLPPMIEAARVISAT